MLHFKPLPDILTMPHTPGPSKDSHYLAFTLPFASSQSHCSQLPYRMLDTAVFTQWIIIICSKKKKKKQPTNQKASNKTNNNDRTRENCGLATILTTTTPVNACLFCYTPLPQLKLCKIVLTWSKMVS